MAEWGAAEQGMGIGELRSEELAGAGEPSSWAAGRGRQEGRRAAPDTEEGRRSGGRCRTWRRAASRTAGGRRAAPDWRSRGGEGERVGMAARASRQSGTSETRTRPRESTSGQLDSRIWAALLLGRALRSAQLVARAELWCAPQLALPGAPPLTTSAAELVSMPAGGERSEERRTLTGGCLACGEWKDKNRSVWISSVAYILMNFDYGASSPARIALPCYKCRALLEPALLQKRFRGPSQLIQCRESILPQSSLKELACEEMDELQSHHSSYAASFSSMQSDLKKQVRDHQLHQPQHLEDGAYFAALSEKEIERRRKIGAANKGKVPWTKGRKWSEEHKKLIRQRTAEALRNPKVMSC